MSFDFPAQFGFLPPRTLLVPPENSPSNYRGSNNSPKNKGQSRILGLLERAFLLFTYDFPFAIFGRRNLCFDIGTHRL
jgi:hypothetical protein